MKTTPLFFIFSIISICSFAQEGFTNKDEAENKIQNNLKEGKWLEYKDSAWGNSSKEAARYYHLVIYKADTPTGVGRDYYISEKIQNEYTYVDGLRNGKSTWYYESGKIKHETNYGHDKENGLWKSYYENGVLELETNYTDGKVNGTYKSYYENGQLKDVLDYTNGSRHGLEKLYYENGQLKEEGNYADDRANGTFKTYYKKGTVKTEINYKGGEFDGKLITYWANGQIKRNDLYAMGRFVLGKITDMNGKEVEYYKYEIMPEYPGGSGEMMRYIQNNVHYPKKARKQGITGRVLIKFVVEKDGYISHVEVIKPVNEELDNEAVRVIKAMPKWSPGLQDGEGVRVYFNVPISFKLN